MVPVLTPRLSSYWVDLVTPLPAALARPLIEGLRTEVVVRAHPETARYLEMDRRDAVDRFQAMIGRKIVVQGVPSYHREQYDVTFK